MVYNLLFFVVGHQGPFQFSAGVNNTAANTLRLRPEVISCLVLHLLWAFPNFHPWSYRGADWLFTDLGPHVKKGPSHDTQFSSLSLWKLAASSPRLAFRPERRGSLRAAWCGRGCSGLGQGQVPLPGETGHPKAEKAEAGLRLQSLDPKGAQCGGRTGPRSGGELRAPALQQRPGAGPVVIPARRSL